MVRLQLQSDCRTAGLHITCYVQAPPTVVLFQRKRGVAFSHVTIIILVLDYVIRNMKALAVEQFCQKVCEVCCLKIRGETMVQLASLQK